MSGNWFIFAVVCFALYIVVVIYFRPRPPQNRHETLSFLDRVRQTKELNRILFLILNLCFWMLVVVLAISAIRYFQG